MPPKNFLRMIQLAGEFFDVENDPEQIQANEHVLERLRNIHPASMGEKCTRDGPVAWTLVFPTSHRLMELFIANKITERELLRRTRAGGKYDAVYLCSVLVLPEYRRKGIARRLAIQSIKSIQQQHSIHYLFYWPFGGAGKKLAEDIAHSLHLPLHLRQR